ncbi:MAG: flagellar hook-associated protein FlgL [Sphingomonas sp.]|uniref:flagellar hook-associated protein FlgL n=1 Tax=Sphingomonas sp. TaxID=28214 RepID=UPI0025F6E116|nr:flagellar hook-associated protein FlgL [Sphingomonas sp.]MBX3562984.1 flagellar hook-associated protein FlgL [Sphingomonas sp.]
MRVSTSQTYQRSMALMSNLSTLADKQQGQIATGKKVVNASDAPGAYRQLATLKRADANDQAYAKNVATAQGILDQADDTLSDIETQIQRAQELFTKAGNGTLTESDRNSIGKELESIRDTLFALANARDSRGQPIFGGATGDLPFAKAADGTITYVSSGEPSGIPIGDQLTMQVGTTGDRAFAADSTTNIFGVISQFTAALSSGGDVKAAANTAASSMTDALANVTAAHASIGARGTRLQMVADQLDYAATARDDARSAVEDVDLAATISNFQQTLTILQATQASFTKLTALSLFDYLR